MASTVPTGMITAVARISETLRSRVLFLQVIKLSYYHLHTFFLNLVDMHEVKYLQLPLPNIAYSTSIPRWKGKIYCIKEIMTNEFNRNWWQNQWLCCRKQHDQVRSLWGSKGNEHQELLLLLTIFWISTSTMSHNSIVLPASVINSTGMLKFKTLGSTDIYKIPFIIRNYRCFTRQHHYVSPCPAQSLESCSVGRLSPH